MIASGLRSPTRVTSTYPQTHSRCLSPAADLQPVGAVGGPGQGTPLLKLWVQ